MKKQVVIDILKNNQINFEDTSQFLLKYINEKFSEVEELHDEEVHELFDYVATQAMLASSMITRQASDQIKSGISTFVQNKDWVSLKSVSKHALEESLSVVENNESSDLNNLMGEHLRAMLWFNQLDGKDRLEIYNKYGKEVKHD